MAVEVETNITHDFTLCMSFDLFFPNDDQL